MSGISASPKAFLTGEALADFRRVKFNSSSEVVYADAGEIGIGATLKDEADAAHAAIQLDNAGGTMKVTANGAIAAGARCFPGADGKVSATPSGASVGIALEASTADGDIIEMLPVQEHLDWQGLTFEAVADNKTLDVEDVGKAFYVTADAKTITLPSTDVMLGPIVIINAVADGGAAVNVSPAAADLIKGPDVAGTDNKDQINTKTTAILHDYISIIADGVEGWVITAKRGIWAEEG